MYVPVEITFTKEIEVDSGRLTDAKDKAINLAFNELPLEIDMKAIVNYKMLLKRYIWENNCRDLTDWADFRDNFDIEDYI